MNDLIQPLCQEGVLSGRLQLRPLLLSDATDMFAYTSDANVCRFLRWGPHTQVAECESFIRGILDTPNREDIHWAICKREDGRLIGLVRIYQIDMNKKQADLSYILNPRQTGKGYMTEAILCVMEVCHKQLGLLSFYADFVKENTASENVMKRCGMVRDISAKPWNMTIKGKPREMLRYVKKM